MVSGLFQMVSGGFRWFQMVSDGFRWFQMVSDGFRWFQMVSGGWNGTIKEICRKLNLPIMLKK